LQVVFVFYGNYKADALEDINSRIVFRLRGSKYEYGYKTNQPPFLGRLI
jgi:hypothetical protein